MNGKLISLCALGVAMATASAKADTYILEAGHQEDGPGSAVTVTAGETTTEMKITHGAIINSTTFDYTPYGFDLDVTAQNSDLAPDADSGIPTGPFSGTFDIFSTGDGTTLASGIAGGTGSVDGTFFPVVSISNGSWVKNFELAGGLTVLTGDTLSFDGRASFDGGLFFFGNVSDALTPPIDQDAAPVVPLPKSAGMGAALLAGLGLKQLARRRKLAGA